MPPTAAPRNRTIHAGISLRDEFFYATTATTEDDKIKEGEQRRPPPPNTDVQPLTSTKAHATVSQEKARTAPPSPPHPGILPQESVPPRTEAATSTGRERDRPHGNGRRQPKASCAPGSLTSNTPHAAAPACVTFNRPQNTGWTHAGHCPCQWIPPAVPSAPPVLGDGMAPGTSQGWFPARLQFPDPPPPVPTPQGQAPPLQSRPQTSLLLQ